MRVCLRQSSPSSPSGHEPVAAEAPSQAALLSHTGSATNATAPSSTPRRAWWNAGTSVCLLQTEQSLQHMQARLQRCTLPYGQMQKVHAETVHHETRQTISKTIKGQLMALHTFSAKHNSSATTG